MRSKDEEAVPSSNPRRIIPVFAHRGKVRDRLSGYENSATHHGNRCLTQCKTGDGTFIHERRNCGSRIAGLSEKDLLLRAPVVALMEKLKYRLSALA